MEFLFEFLAELLFQLLGEVLVAFGWESVSASFRKQQETSRSLACFGYLIIGAMLGAVSALVVPHRISSNDGLSILGVVLNPVVAGGVMRAYGGKRRGAGKPTTHLATFWGGAWLAFGVAAARLGVVIGLFGR